eukprot:TRINITY_DN44948_c0_g1_i2.p1 TRINITY_DN44948_c0_g1~~TRINITY_DN44948_c0_g1_i2.p1  ORF type:complete len:130 (+),score=3.45 TRINITY_DN44948_c0_g1_i2:227-616(+)
MLYVDGDIPSGCCCRSSQDCCIDWSNELSVTQPSSIFANVDKTWQNTASPKCSSVEVGCPRPILVARMMLLMQLPTLTTEETMPYQQVGNSVDNTDQLRLDAVMACPRLQGPCLRTLCPLPSGTASSCQ